jgi:peptidyl-prolyl cis-trans isomerase C
MVKKILIAGFILLIFGVSFVPAGRLSAQSEVILAKVGDKMITQKDLEEFLSRNMSMRRNRPYSPEEKKAMLDNLVRSFVIVAEAEKEKMDETPEFKSKMKLYRVEVLIQDYFAKLPPVTVPEEEIETLLKEHPALVPKETLQLKEILVMTEKEADAVYDELKKGADFSKTAVDKSKSESRVNGGSMRPVTRGVLPKPVEEVAFSLKQGEFSKPIKTEKGYFILYLSERKEKSAEEMNKLTAQVKEKLRSIEGSKKKQDVFMNKAEELKGKAKVEVFYDRIPN